MNITFLKNAWGDYLSWLKEGKKMTSKNQQTD